jgi:hypothetical protein
VEGSAPSETKEETAHRVRTVDVGTLTALRCLHQSEKENDGDKPGSISALRGSRSGRATLRREHRERLESNHREKQEQPSERKER